MESLEIVNTYYEYYLKEKSITKTSKHFSKCSKYLARFFNHYGLEYPIKVHQQRVGYDREYFKVIDTEAKAYFLGFIYADGHITIKDRRKSGWKEYVFRINLSKNDEEVLELFKKELNYTNDLLDIKAKSFVSPSNNKTYTRQPQKLIHLSSEILVKDLMRWGVCENKTYTKLSIPDLPDNLIRHFIRGYFDGDGTVGKLEASITSKDENILMEIKAYVENKLGLPVGNISLSDKNSYRWRISKNRHSFLEFLYKDSNFYLSRKRSKSHLTS
jgi:hypothetical protein